MNKLTFGDVVDAIGEMSVEAQEDLVHVLRRRLAEHGHQRIVEEVRQSRAEYAAGQFRELTVEQLMKEVES